MSGTRNAEPIGMRSVLFALALSACAASQPTFRGNVTVKSSELVVVDPDVRVVADADKPLFFAAGSYWLFHDAKWYRGASVNGPFVAERKLPWQVKKLDQPYAFVHYRKDHPLDQTAVKETTASPDLDLRF